MGAPGRGGEGPINPGGGEQRQTRQGNENNGKSMRGQTETERVRERGRERER